jgi:HEAT repeat protein
MMQEIKKQLSSANVDIRREAVERMRGLKDALCIPILLEAMGDVSWRVRKTAVDILFEDYSVEQYIHGLIQLLYIEDNAGARNSSIEALIRLGRRVTEYLIDAFNTPNKDVRKFIIDVLGERMDPKSLSLMLEAIKDEDDNVRATAVEQLGKRGEISVVDALIDILNSGDLWTAYPAADALGRIGNKKAVPHLLKSLEKKPLREPVLKALSLLSEPSSLEHIIPLLKDQSRNVQEQALKTIEKFYHNGVSPEFITSEMKRMLGDKALDYLIKYAWSNKREVRMSAILLLGLMKDEAAFVPLLDISHEEEFSDDVKSALVFIGSDKPESLLRLFGTDNPQRKRFMCEVAAEIVDPVFLDILEQLLSDEDGHVRSIAAIGVSKLNNVRVVDKIMGLMNDPYEDVQESAVNALSNFEDALQIDHLMDMLKSENVRLRRNAALLLGRIKAKEAIDALGFTLKDENIKVRMAVVEALSLIGSDDAVRYLTYALTDENSDIRISAALSLGAIGGEGVLDSLVILASDPDDAVRVASAKSLGMLKDSRAIETLVALLVDKSGFVVTAAIESLGAIDGDDAKVAILGMLASDDAEIKRTAIISLALFQGVESNLVPFLKDGDWATRIAAVRVLGRIKKEYVKQELEKLLDVEEDPTVIRAVEETLRV